MLNSAVDVVYDHPSKTFLGVRFVLLGFDPIDKDKVRSKLVNGGGIDVGQYCPNCTHLIVDNIVLDDPVCVAARNDGKTLVTGLWVDHSFDVGMPVDPTSIMYRPLRDKNGIPGAKSLMVCLTGYQRQDRDDIMTMVGLMGANFSKPLVANKVTHLVCYKFEGEKYELAKKMKKIKLVNHKWLEDCLKAWEILPEANYDKSGYELETLEAEAKDSEDEAEDQIGERKITASPLTSRTIAEKSDQSPKLKQEISPNQLHSSASKRDLNLSSFSLEIRINNPEVLDSRDSVVLGDFHSAEQSKTHERTPNSVKAGNEPSSASRTAKRSPPPLDSAKLTAMSYSRKTPRRTATASPISGEMAANDMDMDKDILVVSDGFHTDARPEKRKLDSSYGSTKSLKMAENLSPEKSVQNAVIEPVKNSLIDTLTPPSCRKNLLVSDMGVAEIVTSDLRKDFNGGQASDINLDMHKGENSDSYTKPLKKKMIGKSILGSKSNIGKVDSGNKKGSIFLNKSASPAVVDLDMGDKITPFDDETEAPDDRDANGFAVAPPLEKLGEEAEPEHKEDFGSELTEGQKHLSMTTDNNSLPDREGGESDTGKIEKKMEKDECVEDAGKKGIECEKAVDLKETEPIVSTSIEISGKEKGNRGKKHVLVKPKRNNLLSVKKLLNPKVGFDHEGKENEMEKNKTQTERKECVEIIEGGEREIESEKPNDVKKSELGVSTSMEINGKEKTPQRKTKGNSLPALQTQTEKEECAQDGKDRDAVTTDGGKIVISSEKAAEPVDSTSTEINRRKKHTPNKPKKKFLPPGRKIQTEKEERAQDGVDRDVVSTDRGKIVISSEKTAEPVDSISTEITQREKHIPNKTKKNSLPVVEKLTNPKMGGKIGKKKGDKSERENNESVKGENPVEMEKENQPIDNEEKNKGKKLASKSNRAQTKGGKTVKDATEIRKAKAEAVWFILSGHRLQRKEFQQVIKRLKGRVCRDSHHWSYQATHFIAPDPIRRTEKFFAAAASGRWILKTDYLTACNQAGRFLPEEPYEWHKNGLSEDGAINMEAPRKWRLVKERTGHGAFYGMRIVVYGECIAPPLDTLKRAVKAGDGTILATSPPYTRFLESGIDFAIVSPGMPRVDMWVQEFLQHEIPCVLADYLVEYVCKPGYPLDKNVQYNTHSFAEKSFKNLQNRTDEIAEDQTPSQEEEEEEGEGKSDLTCRVCGSRERGEVMMICGDESGSVGCGVGTHIDCCDPPLEEVPEDDWFCPDCKNKVSSCNNNNGKKPRKKIAKRMK